MTLAAESVIGTVLDGRYRLTSFIAEGGMGCVYRGIQEALDRPVAVKLLKDSTEGSVDFQRRFFLEASLCARLAHPNTIRIFDFGCCASSHHYYIVMEFLQGRSVRQLISDEGPLPPPMALNIVQQVCAALIEAHGAGLVHRDLKPSNLFSTPDGMGGKRIKILDFGVVKQLNTDLEITQVQSVLGSPQYMSPEQIRGQDVDGRSDLYSLGIILFQLLTGHLPFRGRDAMAVVMKHITEPIPAMFEVNPTVAVPLAVEEIVATAMAKDPNDRFPDAKSMLVAVNEVAESLGGEWLNAQQHASTFQDIPTGILETLSIEESVADAPEDITQSMVDQLQDVQLDGYRAYIDLNCPYCYALYERLCLWGLVDQIEWCTIEHESHVLDGDFDLRQEEMLSSEVFEVHHRAPDIDLKLPATRCQSTMATRMLAVLHRLFPEAANAVRRATYRALWQDGKNIGDAGVLTEILEQHDVPTEVLEMCAEKPPEFTEWQREWTKGGYDNSIPVLTHRPSGRVLIGLADQSSLAQFLLGERKRVVDRTVCFYQRKPTVLLCGWLSHLWPLVDDINDRVEFIQAPTARRATEMLAEHVVPDLFMIEDGHVDAKEWQTLGALARGRSVPWLMASANPDTDREIEALSFGAIEYLPVVDDSRVARARLQRILNDRFRLTRSKRHTQTDPLTRLLSRRTLLERLESEWERALERSEPISVILANIDGFKAFNKAHGYLVGDQFLMDFARDIRGFRFSHECVPGRFGGNEFLFILPNCMADLARQTAEHLRSHVAAMNVYNRATEAPLSISVGVFSVSPDAISSVYGVVDGAHTDLQNARQMRNGSV